LSYTPRAATEPGILVKFLLRSKIVMPVRLEFSGSELIGVTRQRVWERLVDPHFVAQSIPGVESVRIDDPHHFQIKSVLGVGPVRLELTIDGEFRDLREPEHAGLRAAAAASGSTVTLSSDVRLTAVEDDRTILDWATTVEVDGTLAGLGSRMLESIAHKLTTEVWTGFARRVTAEG
jgi:hypothetical protein